MTPSRLTSWDIKKALRATYDQKGRPWVFFDEFSPGTGYSNAAACRIDGWAMACWPSMYFRCLAFEIKVSRGDFLREIRNPSKREFAMQWSNAFFFVTPAGLLFDDELPAECGLIEVKPDLSIRAVVNAAERKMPAPTWDLVASVARRAARQEAEQHVGTEIAPGVVAHVAPDIDPASLDALRELGKAALKKLDSDEA